MSHADINTHIDTLANDNAEEGHVKDAAHELAKLANKHKRNVDGQTLERMRKSHDYIEAKKQKHRAKEDVVQALDSYKKELDTEGIIRRPFDSKEAGKLTGDMLPGMTPDIVKTGVEKVVENSADAAHFAQEHGTRLWNKTDGNTVARVGLVAGGIAVVTGAAYAVYKAGRWVVGKIADGVSGTWEWMKRNWWVPALGAVGLGAGGGYLLWRNKESLGFGNSPTEKTALGDVLGKEPKSLMDSPFTLGSDKIAFTKQARNSGEERLLSVNDKTYRLTVSGNNLLKDVQWKDGRVWINDSTFWTPAEFEKVIKHIKEGAQGGLRTTVANTNGAGKVTEKPVVIETVEVPKNPSA